MHLRLPTSFGRPAFVISALLLGGFGLATASVLTLLPLATTGNDFHEPGTQPTTLQNSILDSTNCTGCHSGWDEAQEPYRRWASSMMGQAGRDPVFWAALTIANQDATDAGEYCLRCHAPGAWLDGRCVPGDGSLLDPALGDFDGVTCNFCHRLVDPVYQPGWSPPDDVPILAALTEPPVFSPHSGQYVVDPYDRRRGPFDLGSGFGYHAWEQSHYHFDSRLCGNCHDVSNPAFSRQSDGSYQLNALNTPHPTQEKVDEFPVERTYSEWTQSDFSKRMLDTQGRFGGDQNLVSSCEDCHQPKITGTACIPVLGGAVRPDLPQHNFNGANSWVLRAVRNLFSDSTTGLSAGRVAASELRNKAMLTNGTELLLSTDAAGLRVRVVNHGGHKFPTGYGEGRRAWINVKFFDAGGALLAERGHYDSTTALLTTGDTKVYELFHGLDAYMAGITGLPQGQTFHFVLNNSVMKDSRVPPMGFTNAGFAEIQDEPVGASYADEQYWDDTLYTLPAGAASAEVKLYHQTSSKEYVEFLQNENTTDLRGQTAYNQWVATGMSAPVLLHTSVVDFSGGSTLQPLRYGLGKRLSNGRVPSLDWSGSTSVSGPGLQLTITQGMPNQLAQALWSPAMVHVPFNGGARYVGSPSVRLSAITLGPTGSGTIPVALDASMIGSARNYQLFMRDPGDAWGLGMSNGLHIEFYP